MCRNIRVLFHSEPPTTDDEIHAAALQYVRKVSGSTRPSRPNQAAFDAAVDEVAAVTRRLLRDGLVASGAPRTREQEAARAKERGRRRELRGASPQAERVRFVPWEEAALPAEAAFTSWAAVLRQVLPDSAEVEHVGATAIPGSWTKGDLDLCVRVPLADFDAADAALAGQLPRHTQNTPTATYRSFSDDRRVPPLGVQLVVRGGPEDFFVRLRDGLRRDPDAVAALNALRVRHQGGSMRAYRAEKAAFYEAWLGRA
jgi:hypothetical protein